MTCRSLIPLAVGSLAILVAAASLPAAAQTPGAPANDVDTALGADLGADLGVLLADTSRAAATAALRVEEARLRLARQELGELAWFRRLRPRVDLFVSASMRGLAFPSISSQGYDPTYAAIARWPGDTWGVTASWSLDQLLDRRPLHRARAAVAVAEARVELHHARHAEREAAERERRLARAEREAETHHRADLAARTLRIEAGFLAHRLDAQRELLRLAEMKYDQGEADYESVARQRLAVLAAEHAQATNTARLAAIDTAGDVDLALRIGTPTALGTPTEE